MPGADPAPAAPCHTDPVPLDVDVAELLDTLAATGAPAQRLAASGAPVEIVCYPGVVHGALAPG